MQFKCLCCQTKSAVFHQASAELLARSQRTTTAQKTKRGLECNVGFAPLQERTQSLTPKEAWFRQQASRESTVPH